MATLWEEIGKAVVGQKKRLMDYMSIFAIASSSNSGLAKTLLVQTLASVLELDFQRIQFTPDLMPSDITGAEVLRRRPFGLTKDLFSNIVLADEINHTSKDSSSPIGSYAGDRLLLLVCSIFYLNRFLY